MYSREEEGGRGVPRVVGGWYLYIPFGLVTGCIPSLYHPLSSYSRVHQQPSRH